jgi:hypothetical protein
MNPNVNLRVLTVTNLGETEALNARITLSAMSIKMTAAMDGVIQDRPVKLTTILFLDDSDPVSLALSEFDLLQIESVVGSYGFFEG